MSVASEQVSGLNLGTQRRQITGHGPISAQPRGGQVFYPGGLAVRRIGSTLAEVPVAGQPYSPDYVLLGYWNPSGQGTYTSSSTSVDANGGEIDPITGNRTSLSFAPLSASGTSDFATGTGVNKIVASMRGQPAFIFDDGTYYATDMSGTLSFGGWIVDVDATSGRVTIAHSETLSVFYELYSAGTAAYGSTQDGAARLVATNIPAGTFAAGGFTVTATGAFPTQDGLAGPYNVGDVIVFPAGTITTQVVSAANSGPYEVTVVGATGVQATFARPAWWAHGALIRSESRIRIGAEGTALGAATWRADPATSTKLVGTDDPKLAPERFTTQLTLSGGTKTVSAVPIRAIPGTAALCTMVTGGTPAATTTSYQVKSSAAGIAAGGIGTAAVIIEAQDVAGHLVNTDVAILNVTIFQ